MENKKVSGEMFKSLRELRDKLNPLSYRLDISDARPSLQLPQLLPAAVFVLHHHHIPTTQGPSASALTSHKTTINGALLPLIYLCNMTADDKAP